MLTLANGLILPSFEAMDERFHFNLVRYLADGHPLPDQRDIALAIEEGYHQQGGQAPLYYVLNALLWRALKLDTTGWADDAATLATPNELSSCGDVSRTISKGLYLRWPQRERWPYTGAALGVHLLRACNSVWALVTILGVYFAARTSFPGIGYVPMLAAALAGLNPRFLLHSSTVTNDTLLAALAAWGVYLATATLRRGPTLGRTLALGLVAGLAALAKLGGVFLLPLAALVFAEVARRERKWLRGLGHLALVGGVWLAIAGWWYIGNWLRYGDLALVPLYTANTVGGLRKSWPPDVVIPEIITVFRTFWTNSGFCNFEVGFLPFYTVLSFVGLGGLLLALVRPGRDPRATRQRAALLILWAALGLLSWLRFNSQVWAPDGRYLYMALAAIMPLLAAGLQRVFGLLGPVVRRVAWRVLTIVLGLLALGAPVLATAPLFSPPRVHAASAVAVPRPLDASFGGQVRLLGYDVDSESLRAGETVDVTLYLTADQPITESLMLGLQIASIGRDDNTVLVNLRSWPGGGRYPTTAWRPGEVLIDHYSLCLPDNVIDLQVWDLDLLVLHAERTDGVDERLQVTVEGAPGGTAVALTRLRVVPLSPEEPPLSALMEPPPAFGSNREVILRAAEVSEDDGSLRVRLWWQVEQPVGDDYTVFAHLLDADGGLVAAGDDVPRRGAMPTSYWRSGDLIADEYHIPLPGEAPSDGWRVGVGFYRADGRLPAWDGLGDPLPGATAIVAEWR